MDNHIEILEYNGPGYKSLMSFESWRVAVSNDSKTTAVESIPAFEKHELTDEVFVLLKGVCTLFTAGNHTEPQEIISTDMEIGKVYNVKRGTWHTRRINKGTSVLIVENDNTGADNSPKARITPEQRSYLSISNTI